MKLRRLVADDLEVVRKLRNDNRAAFFDDATISAEAQQRWFARLNERPVAFYVIEVDGAVVGTISITDTSEGREIGNLVLDRNHRGRGLMTEAIRELTREPGRYFAMIKPGNQPSLAAFDRAGFQAEAVRMSKQSTD